MFTMITTFWSRCQLTKKKKSKQKIYFKFSLNFFKYLPCFDLFFFFSYVLSNFFSLKPKGISK